MNNMLAFLSQVTVEAVVVPVKATAQARAPKEYQPKDDIADLRIWENGAIYPSNALVAEFNLEYTAKDSANSGNGFDIVDTALVTTIKTPQRFIAISATARKEGKLDVFRATTYKEDGSASTSVTVQGTAMYGKESLLPLLKEVYNVVPNEEGFIDLVIFRAMPITSPNGIFHFPKTVSRGENKGQVSYVRRENQTIYALSPVEDSKFITPEEVVEEETPAQDVIEIPVLDLPGTRPTPSAEHPTPESDVLKEVPSKPAQEPIDTEKYDVLKVGNIEVEVEKETNPLFLNIAKQNEEAQKVESTDPFATLEEEEEDVVITDAEIIQDEVEAGAYDEEGDETIDEDAEVIEEDEDFVGSAPSNPFADVPFTRPSAAAINA